MKRIVALALTAVMALSLAACGSSQKDAATETAAASASAAAVTCVDDLPGKTIGVQLGTTGDIYASDYEAEGSTIERFNKGNDAVQALLQGKVDCVIIDSQPAAKFVENAEGLKILDDPFVEEEYAICLKKDNEELLDKMNGALKELKEVEDLIKII